MLDVVLVTYRSELALRSGLHVVKEKLSNLNPRYYVFDNNPGDGCHEYIRELLPEARVMSCGTNIGFAAAVNKAVSEGTSEFVLLLNPDVLDILGDPGDLIDELKSNPALGAVACRLIDRHGNTIPSCRRFATPIDYFFEYSGLVQFFPRWRRLGRFRILDWDYSDRRSVDAASGAFLLLRRQALQNVGLLDDQFFMYSEEMDWQLRAYRWGYRVLYTPTVSAVHDTSKGTTLRPVLLRAMMHSSQLKYVRKHFGPLAAHTVRLSFWVVDAIRLLRLALKAQETRDRLDDIKTIRDAYSRVRLR